MGMPICVLPSPAMGRLPRLVVASRVGMRYDAFAVRRRRLWMSTHAGPVPVGLTSRRAQEPRAKTFPRRQAAMLGDTLRWLLVSGERGPARRRWRSRDRAVTDRASVDARRRTPWVS